MISLFLYILLGCLDLRAFYISQGARALWYLGFGICWFVLAGLAAHRMWWKNANIT